MSLVQIIGMNCNRHLTPSGINLYFSKSKMSYFGLYIICFISDLLSIRGWWWSSILLLNFWPVSTCNKKFFTEILHTLRATSSNFCEYSHSFPTSVADPRFLRYQLKWGCASLFLPILPKTLSKRARNRRGWWCSHWIRQCTWCGLIQWF